MGWYRTSSGGSNNNINEKIFYFTNLCENGSTRVNLNIKDDPIAEKSLILGDSTNIKTLELVFLQTMGNINLLASNTMLSNLKTLKIDYNASHLYSSNTSVSKFLYSNMLINNSQDLLLNINFIYNNLFRNCSFIFRFFSSVNNSNIYYPGIEEDLKGNSQYKVFHNGYCYNSNIYIGNLIDSAFKGTIASPPFLYSNFYLSNCYFNYGAGYNKANGYFIHLHTIQESNYFGNIVFNNIIIEDTNNYKAANFIRTGSSSGSSGVTTKNLKIINLNFKNCRFISKISSYGVGNLLGGSILSLNFDNTQFLSEKDNFNNNFMTRFGHDNMSLRQVYVVNNSLVGFYNSYKYNCYIDNSTVTSCNNTNCIYFLNGGTSSGILNNCNHVFIDGIVGYRNFANAKQIINNFGNINHLHLKNMPFIDFQKYAENLNIYIENVSNCSNFGYGYNASNGLTYLNIYFAPGYNYNVCNFYYINNQTGGGNFNNRLAFYCNNISNLIDFNNIIKRNNSSFICNYQQLDENTLYCPNYLFYIYTNYTG